MKLGFSRTALKYRISRKSVQWEPSRCMRADERPDRQMTKIIAAFRNFETAYKCYAKNKTTIKTQTRSSLTDPFLTYPFPILRSLSSHSTITIYISSSPSPGPSSQWPIDGCPTPIVVFCHCGRAKVSQAVRNIIV